MPEKYVLEMKNINKEYYGTRVLKDINLAVKPGEIHGIVGENGAGKSTLMNILFGMNVIHATGGYDGTLNIEGEPVDISCIACCGVLISTGSASILKVNRLIS